VQKIMANSINSFTREKNHCKGDKKQLMGENGVLKGENEVIKNKILFEIQTRKL